MAIPKGGFTPTTSAQDSSIGIQETTPNQVQQLLNNLTVNHSTSPRPLSSRILTGQAQYAANMLTGMLSKNILAPSKKLKDTNPATIQSAIAQEEIKTEAAKDLLGWQPVLGKVFSKYSTIDFNCLLVLPFGMLIELAYLRIFNYICRDNVAKMKEAEKDLTAISSATDMDALLATIFSSFALCEKENDEINRVLTQFKEYAQSLDCEPKKIRSICQDIELLIQLQRKYRHAYNFAIPPTQNNSEQYNAATLFVMQTMQEVIHIVDVVFPTVFKELEGYIDKYIVARLSLPKPKQKLEGWFSLKRDLIAFSSYVSKRFKELQTFYSKDMAQSARFCHAKCMYLMRAISYRTHHLQFMMHQLLLESCQLDNDKIAGILIQATLTKTLLINQEACGTLSYGMHKLREDLLAMVMQSSKAPYFNCITLLISIVNDMAEAVVTNDQARIAACRKQIEASTGFLSPIYYALADLFRDVFQMHLKEAKKSEKVLAKLALGHEQLLPKVSSTIIPIAIVIRDFLTNQLNSDESDDDSIIRTGTVLNGIKNIVETMMFEPYIPIEIFRAKQQLLMQQKIMVNLLTESSVQAITSASTNGLISLHAFDFLGICKREASFMQLPVGKTTPDFFIVLAHDQIVDQTQDWHDAFINYLSHFQTFVTKCHHMHVRQAIRRIDEDWLDQIDQNSEGCGSPSIQDIPEPDIEEDIKAKSELCPSLPASAIAKVTLPLDIPKTLSGLLGCFKNVLGQFYSLHRPFAAPIDSQTMHQSPAQLAMRQQLFAIDCLQKTLTLQAGSVSEKQRHVLVTFGCLWQHQAIEQGLTVAYIQKKQTPLLPHYLSHLLNGLTLSQDYQSVKENDNATSYFRYPFSLPLSSSSPLALRHIVKATSATFTALTKELPVWIGEHLAITATLLGKSKDTENFQRAVEALSTPLTSLEEEQKMQQSQSLSSEECAIVERQKAGLEALNQPMHNLIETLSPWDQFYQQKRQRLNNICLHLERLSVLLDLFKDLPHREYLFLHALMAQLVTQYLIENVGSYLSLVREDPHHTHSLKDYCDYFHLNAGLSDTQKKLLVRIDLRKGSEYLFKQTLSSEDWAYPRKKQLSDLYSHCQVEEGFAPSGHKSKSTRVLQNEVMTDLVQLTELTVAIINNQLLD